MTPTARLSADNEDAMSLIRGRVSPYKSAAIAGILYSEQLGSSEEEIKKLQDAVDFLALEIKRISNYDASYSFDGLLDGVSSEQ